MTKLFFHEFNYWLVAIFRPATITNYDYNINFKQKNKQDLGKKNIKLKSISLLIIKIFSVAVTASKRVL